MKKIITAGISAAALMLSMSASAGESVNNDEGVYVNLGTSLFDVNSEIFSVVGRIGYNISDNFGVEGEGSIGVSTEKDGGTKIQLKSQFGGFGVARMPVGDKGSVFARLGYHTTKLEVDAVDRYYNAINGTVSLDGAAFGIGGNYMFDANNGVRIDYTGYAVSEDDLEGSFDTVSVSYVRRF